MKSLHYARRGMTISSLDIRLLVKNHQRAGAIHIHAGKPRALKLSRSSYVNSRSETIRLPRRHRCALFITLRSCKLVFVFRLVKYYFRRGVLDGHRSFSTESGSFCTHREALQMPRPSKRNRQSARNKCARGILLARIIYQARTFRRAKRRRRWRGQRSLWKAAKSAINGSRSALGARVKMKTVAGTRIGCA